ncbi:hypothetical protein CLCR_00344 [Cladophialophora carrionii]|uniref:Uncharacterized protein n=1 Tax=Cladophialophora carrionii TaxID=86049 RepID=A0A1C1D0P3_9EURO|nr:hypothetical protein CLCR_00344 [Cladophialophora carrionii]
MDSGAHIVAKIPFRVTGPPDLMTKSEVVTVTNVRSHIQASLYPKSSIGNPDARDPVGAEYIIMEDVSRTGVQLHEVWPTMDTHQYMLVTKNPANAVAEMANLTVPAYGSLYLATHARDLRKNGRRR